MSDTFLLLCHIVHKNPMPRRARSRKVYKSRNCVHGRTKPFCKECGGVAFCQHGGRKYTCRQCNIASYCQHNILKYKCTKCKDVKVLVCRHGIYGCNCIECTAIDVLANRFYQ